jgi:rhodanese-related sulfurtransferase
MEHTKEFLELTTEARRRVKEISVAEAREKIERGATLIDVREDNEWENGHAAGATHIGRGVIERDIVGKVPDKNQELILYCGGGYRSALAADNLQKMGYTNVFSMWGGWTAWQEANAPVEK